MKTFGFLFCFPPKILWNIYWRSQLPMQGIKLIRDIVEKGLSSDKSRHKAVFLLTLHILRLYQYYILRSQPSFMKQTIFIQYLFCS